MSNDVTDGSCIVIERRWIRIDDSWTQDHIKPRTTVEKLANQYILQSELGSIVLLFFYYHVQLKNGFIVCLEFDTLLTLVDINKINML